MLYSRKLTEHCKPAIMEKKNKNHSIKTTKKKKEREEKEREKEIAFQSSGIRYPRGRSLSSNISLGANL